MSKSIVENAPANLTPTPEVKAVNKNDLKSQRERDSKMIRVKFMFHECPGGMLSHVFKKHKGDEVKRYDLIDGQIYNIPVGLYKHLNENGWYPVYDYAPGEPGMFGAFNHMTGTVMKICRKVRRFSAQSMEFLDIDDNNYSSHESGLLQVSLS